MLVINGSPFHMRSKQRARERVLAARARETACRWSTSTWSAARTSSCSTAARSSVDAARRRAVSRAAVRGRAVRRRARVGRRRRLAPARRRTRRRTPPLVERVYGALVLGTRDYVEKNGFPRRRARAVRRRRFGARRSRSPSTRSAPERVHAVMMPSRLHVGDEPRGLRPSRPQARACATTRCPIEPMFEATLGVLQRPVRRACRRTRPRRTSRRAAAACC